MLSLSQALTVICSPSSAFALTLLALASIALYKGTHPNPRPAPAPAPDTTLVNAGNVKMVDRKMEENIAQFCGVTGASVKDAKKFLEKYKRVDVAVDAYYGDPAALSAASAPAPPRAAAASTSKLNAVFDTYKDPDGADITVDGTLRLCADLGVNPEDVVLLAVAYELKSPRVGEWGRAGWVEGWKAIGADNLAAMRLALPRLRTRLASDAPYFTQVYNKTFEFAKQEGQRSVGAPRTAQAFWRCCSRTGWAGGAVARVDEDGESFVIFPLSFWGCAGGVRGGGGQLVRRRGATLADS
ncbi:hypothetical protein C8R46DRAFT_1106563, partial [Mycena filopes]